MFGSTSTRNGSAPAIRIAVSVAGKVKAGSTTRPLTPAAIKGAARAAVPLEVATQADSAPPQVAARAASSRRESGPKLENLPAS